MDNSTFYISEEELSEMFFNQNLTYKEMAEKCGVGIDAVRRFIKKYGFRKSKEQIAENARKGTLKVIERQHKDDPGREVLNSEERLRELYIKQNLGMETIANMLGVPYEKVRYAIRKFGFKKTWDQRMEVRANQLMEKYGVDNVAKLKEVRDKTKNTCLEKYGATTAMGNPETIKKRNKTNQQKYGFTDPMKNPAVVEKRKQTCLEKYGVDNVRKTTEVQLKESLNYFSQDVAESLFDRDKFRNKVMECPIRTSAAIAKEWGCTQQTVLHLMDRHDSRDLLESGVSTEEKEIGKFLDEIGIRHTKDRKKLKRTINGKISIRELDLFCPDFNIAVEYNGVFWHNIYKKEHNSHMDKAKRAEESGIKLFQVFSWEYEEDKEGVLKQIKALFSPKIILPNNDFALVQKNRVEYSVYYKEEEVYRFFIYPHGDKYLELRDFFIYSNKEPEYKTEFIFQAMRLLGYKKIAFFAERGKIFDDFFKGTEFKFYGEDKPRLYFVNGNAWTEASIIDIESDLETIRDGLMVEGCGDKIWVCTID